MRFLRLKVAFPVGASWHLASRIFEELIAQDPDITLFELRDAPAAAEGVGVRHSSIAVLLSRLGFTYKKSLVATERCRARVRLARHD